MVGAALGLRTFLLCLHIAAVATLVWTTASVSGCTRASNDDVLAGKVVLFALDAGTWDVIDPLIERGLLPNIAKLKAEGASAILVLPVEKMLA